MISDKNVGIAVYQNAISYPVDVPYSPLEDYPELSQKVYVGGDNAITYSLIREFFFTLGMDRENYSSPKWNPMKGVIHPGDKVVIKPNLVRHLHLGGGDYWAVITHPSLVRTVLDYVALALKGKGEITVGDAPLQSTDFEEVLKKTGLKQVCEDAEKRWKIPVRLVDFRLWQMELNEHHQYKSGTHKDGDIKGYYRVNLGMKSCLAPVSSHYNKYRVTFYDPREMKEHHNSHTNEYIIPRSILEADVIINLPKLKTHRKVGITAALKNLVGINGHKDWLPHHRVGPVVEGGDEYKDRNIFKVLQTDLDEKIHRNHQSILNSARLIGIRAVNKLSRILGTDKYYEGSWYGNDTLWRTVLDLNRLLIYADKGGKMTLERQRRCFTIVDAIIAGEGEGPMEPDSRKLGMVVGGKNPLAVDAVLATLIGFDYRKIPIIKNGFSLDQWPLVKFKHSDITVRSNNDLQTVLKVGEPFHEYDFKPAAGWVGYIESKKSTRKEIDIG
jgi:uncharacterized protein (DUF362 family)